MAPETSRCELLRLSHPLLRRLLREAPGTYCHSLIVGRLAESAAREIGADRLVARHGGWFHDVGKLRRPASFAENERPETARQNRARHGETMAAIRAHVSDGVRLARRSRLPSALVDIIGQHHGTSRTEFASRRGKAAGRSGARTRQGRRYPGPKPRSLEAAIVLLADAVEAASRTFPEPSPARLRELVRGVFRSKVADGQLAESPLSASHLARMETSFARVLAEVFKRESRRLRAGQRQSRRTSIEIVNVQDAVPIDGRALSAAARAALKDVPGRYSVAIVDNRRMSRLNRRYLGRRGPTDVMAFPYGSGTPAKANCAGEIVVSAELAASEAKARGAAVAAELALYVVHGALHLAGFDDSTRRQAAEMHARERGILAKLGLGAVRLWKPLRATGPSFRKK